MTDRIPAWEIAFMALVSAFLGFALAVGKL